MCRPRSSCVQKAFFIEENGSCKVLAKSSVSWSSSKGRSAEAAMAMRLEVLAGLAFLFSVGFLLQILGCALYNNWWPMLTGLMYIMLPMPCLFFGGDSSGFINSEGGDWGDAAKFLTGFSSVGSIAIPAILRHADLITGGAMWIEFSAFFVLLATVAIFQHVTQEEDYF